MKMEPSDTADKKITVSPEKQNSIIYDRESIFQRPLYHKLDQILDDHWKFLNQIQESQMPRISLCRTHNTILVDGDRGSGKTVFISNIESNIKKETLVHYEFLDVVDPSLLSDCKVIDCCESLCSMLVSILHDRIKTFRKERPLSENDKNDYSKIFREVADCLLSLKTATEESGLDSIFVHGNAISLEQKLHEYFSFVSKRIFSDPDKGIDKKILCFRFDDIDMSLKSGFLILETLHKYFSSPWVVPIVCGDLRLYQLVTKLEFQKKLFNPKNEVETRPEINELVSKYLTKIFPGNCRLKITKWSDFLDLNYHRIYFLVQDKNSSGVELSLDKVDKFLDTYFNPGINQEKYKEVVLTSHKKMCDDGRNIPQKHFVKDSLRFWLQFHEKMYPFYRESVQKGMSDFSTYEEKKQPGKIAFDFSLYRQLQESLFDFFVVQDDYSELAALARINVRATYLSTIPYLNCREALAELSVMEKSTIPREGAGEKDKKIRFRFPHIKTDTVDTVKDQYRFLIQLFTADDYSSETGEMVSLFSGRFVHFLFSTLFEKNKTEALDILFAPPIFSSLDEVEKYVTNEEDKILNNPFYYYLKKAKANDIWAGIVKNNVDGQESEVSEKKCSLPFFDVIFLQKILTLYFTNINRYRSEKYTSESVFDYMTRCAIILLHAVYSCERKDSVAYKNVAITRQPGNLVDGKRISNIILPEIDTIENDPNSVSYHLYHHPLFHLIFEIESDFLKIVEKSMEQEDGTIQHYWKIRYFENNLTESDVKSKIENAESLDEISGILKIVNNELMFSISKYSYRTNAFRRIKKLYSDPQTSQNSRAYYEDLCKKNRLSNLVPTSPAWKKCVVE